MSDMSPLGSGHRGGRDYWSQTPPWFVVVVAALLIAILVSVLLLLLSDDGNQIQTVAPTLTTEDSSTTISQPTTTANGSTTVNSSTSSSETTSSSTSGSTQTSDSATSTSTTVTTISSTTSTVDPQQYISAVWPWTTSSVRYDQPTDAAQGFAVDFLGFRSPIIGPFQQGDTRSGEVEIRPATDGPVTTILVRQLGPDNSWWVLGAATANITIGDPGALEEIDSPLVITGSALAFEGSVGVELRADGSDALLVDSFVTGGGATKEPFDGSFEWVNPGSGAGALILTTASMEDGRPWEAAVRRVVFQSE